MKEAWLKLLTGLIDGELAPAERQMAEKLLRQSAEARRLYAALTRQSQNLKALPKLKAPHDLTRSIGERIRRAAPARPAVLPFWRGVMPYVAAAAGLLLVVSLSWFTWSSYLAQDRLAQPERTLPRVLPFRPVEVAPKAPETDTRLAVEHLAQALQSATAAALKGMTESASRTGLITSQDLLQAALRQELLARAVAALGELGGPAGQATHALRELTRPFRRLDFTLPTLLTAEELSGNVPRLTSAVKSGGVFQFDLASKDPARTVESLIAAGRDKQLRFIIDAEAKAAIEKRHAAVFHIYLENLAPEGFDELILAFDRAERLAATERRSLVSVILGRLDTEAQRQLALNLGVPASSIVSGNHHDIKITPDTVPADPRKPPTSPTRPGESIRPADAAVVYLHKPERKGEFASKEVRMFLDNRAGPQVGRVSLLIVIRSSE
jgi:anti-sigma factor RsiW